MIKLKVTISLIRFEQRRGERKQILWEGQGSACPPIRPPGSSHPEWRGLLRVPLGAAPPLRVTRVSASNLRTTSYCLLSVYVSVCVFVSVNSLGCRKNLPESSLCLESTSPEVAGKKMWVVWIESAWPHMVNDLEYVRLAIMNEGNR